MKVDVIGLDLAKNVFQVYGVDEHGKAVLTKRLKRAEMATFFATLPPCLIGLEACASAHYWGRQLEACGHTVRLIAPQFVKPYVKSNKNDARDAEAICEAVSRPSMRFVPLKSPESQALLAPHRGRSGLVKARTMCANQVRGLLASALRAFHGSQRVIVWTCLLSKRHSALTLFLGFSGVLSLIKCVHQNGGGTL